MYLDPLLKTLLLGVDVKFSISCVSHCFSISQYSLCNYAATDDVDLECESSIGNVFASILECEAEFELVDIQCTIDDIALDNCKPYNNYDPKS